MIEGTAAEVDPTIAQTPLKVTSADIALAQCRADKSRSQRGCLKDGAPRSKSKTQHVKRGT